MKIRRAALEAERRYFLNIAGRFKSLLDKLCSECYNQAVNQRRDVNPSKLAKEKIIMLVRFLKVIASLSIIPIE